MDAVRWIATYDGEEQREELISQMLSNLKRGISNHPRGIALQHDGEEVHLYNPELHD